MNNDRLEDFNSKEATIVIDIDELIELCVSLKWFLSHNPKDGQLSKSFEDLISYIENHIVR